jgi:2-isopropylmalate synthase
MFFPDRSSAAPTDEPLVYDWNRQGKPARVPKVLDETLRDGLQSASVRDPSIGEKLSLLHAMVDLGVDAAMIGMPSARAKQREHVLRLAREVATERLPITVSCAARTYVADITPVVEVSQRAGIAVEVAIFVASSPIRQYVDGQSHADLQRLTEDSVSFAHAHQLPVLFVTEDTTRSKPETLRLLYSTAIRAGAERVCVADTVGHATPEGAARLVAFISDLVAEVDPRVRIDWHGHRDRGLSVANSLAAWLAGAERCHGTALGVGERSGNTPLELLLVNLELLGWRNRDLTTLTHYTDLAARALGVSIAPNTPVVGKDAFRTATGVHASVLARAARKGQVVRDQVYSGVSAAMVGRAQRVEIGPMSGRSNVRQYLEERSIAASDALVEAVLRCAKSRDVVLSEEEVRALASNVSNHISRKAG